LARGPTPWKVYGGDDDDGYRYWVISGEVQYCGVLVIGGKESSYVTNSEWLLR